MTDRKATLQALLAKAEAWGELPRPMPFPVWQCSLVLGAYRGSLDAAKALHDAVLPGWDLLISTYEDGLFEVSVSDPTVVKTHDGLSEIIARAWLTAIIRALIEKEQSPA